MVNEVSNGTKVMSRNGRFGICLSWLIPSVLVVAGIVIELVLAHPAYAAVFNIASGDVAGLINAINTANSNGQDNTINLATGTFTLTAVDNTNEGANGLPSITGKMTIHGAGDNITVIQRNGNAPSFRIFHVAATGTLTLKGLTVEGGFIECCIDGFVSNIGGGISNDGLLIITNSLVSGNSAVYEGGGIAGGGSVSITNSTVSFNSAQDGGGIFSYGPVTITSSSISDNSAEGFGGGIWGGLPLTIIDSTISGNTIQSFGGGIASGPMVLTNSIISNNSSGFIGGGIFFFGGVNSTSTITKSTISNNTGDGIFNTVDSALTIIDSAISDNSRSVSIFNAGGLIDIFNTTISNNVVAIENDQDGTVNIVNSTITNNTIGIYNPIYEFNPFGKIELQNTILALNTGNTLSDCFGTITSLGNNIIGDTTDCTITLKSTDLTGNPGLGTFTDNGTPGNGHYPLLSNSQAINAGNNNVCLSNPILATDQIGDPRVDICDIGSIEFEQIKNLGQCISTLIQQNCSGLQGNSRATCNKQQQTFCFNLFKGK